MPFLILALLSRVFNTNTQSMRFVRKHMSLLNTFLFYFYSTSRYFILFYFIFFPGLFLIPSLSRPRPLPPTSLSSAGNRVSQLFLSRGVTTIANDTVVDFGLTLFALAATLVYMMSAYLVYLASSYASRLASWETGGLVAVMYPAAFGFLACVIVISTTLEVVRSSFKAVFVCFVQVSF